MKLDPSANADLSPLVAALDGLDGKMASLQQQLQTLSQQVQMLSLEMPRPIEDFGPRIADGASATSLAGTDPKLGGPEGGFDKGGAGYGVKELP